MNITKKLTGITLFSLVLLGPTSQVFAVTYGDATNGKSDATVEFIENEGSGTIIDPLAPDVPIDPENPINPNLGALRINYVSDFSFEKLQASGSDATTYAALDSVANAGTTEYREVPNFISVQDDRGSNAGWKLTVAQSGQLEATTTGDSPETYTLEGAEITFKNGYNANSSSAYQPTVTSNDMTLDVTGATQDVAVAEANKGMSSWSIAFGSTNELAADSVQLVVPGETMKVKDVQYKTELNWNLADTPN